MVQRQFGTWKNSPAELASIAVAKQNVFARKRAALLRNVAIGEQPNYRGNFMGVSGRMNLGAVHFFRLCYTLQEQDHGAAHGGDVDRLVGGIQNEHRFLHQGSTTGSYDW